MLGPRHNVEALALDSAGNLYVAGDFAEADGIPASGIAKCNGVAWSGLGSGIEGYSSALACGPDDTLYGHFWFFYGALTDLNYNIRVTDTVTGTVKLYQGEQGKQTSGRDLTAF